MILSCMQEFFDEILYPKPTPQSFERFTSDKTKRPGDAAPCGRCGGPEVKTGPPRKMEELRWELIK